MGKNSVYSLLALSALPLGAEAAVVQAPVVDNILSPQNWQGNVNTNLLGGRLVVNSGTSTFNAGKLVPGKYTLTATTGRIGGIVGINSAAATITVNGQSFNLEETTYSNQTRTGQVDIELTEEADVTISIATEGTVYLNAMSLELNFDFDAVADDLQKQWDKVAANYDGERYDYDGNKGDLDKNATIVENKINAIKAGSYKAYVDYELYKEDSEAVAAVEQLIADAKSAAEEKQYNKDKAAIDEAQAKVDAAQKEIDKLEDGPAKDELNAKNQAAQAAINAYSEAVEAAKENGEMAGFNNSQDAIDKLKEANDAAAEATQAVKDNTDANSGAMMDLNAAIETAQKAYNEANNELKQELNNPVYADMLAEAQAELSTQAKIIAEQKPKAEAADAAGTAADVKDEIISALDAAMNEISDIKIKYLDQKNQLETAYANATNGIEELQTKLDELKNKIDDRVAADFQSRLDQIQKDIDKLTTDTETNYEAHDLAKLNINTEKTRIDNEITRNEKLRLISDAQLALDDAKAALSDKKYEQDNKNVIDFYNEDFTAWQTAITNAKSKMEKAKNNQINTTGNNPAYKSKEDIEQYAQAAQEALANYIAVQQSIADSEKALADADAKLKEECADVYDAAGLEPIQAKIDAKKAEIAAALEKKKAVHSTAMSAIEALDIKADIDALIQNNQSSQDQFDLNKAENAYNNVLKELTERYNAVGSASATNAVRSKIKNENEIWNIRYGQRRGYKSGMQDFVNSLGGEEAWDSFNDELIDISTSTRSTWNDNELRQARNGFDAETVTEDIAKMSEAIGTFNKLGERLETLSKNIDAAIATVAAIKDLQSQLDAAKAEVAQDAPDVKADFDEAFQTEQGAIDQLKQDMDAAIQSKEIAAKQEDFFNKKEEEIEKAIAKIVEDAKAAQANFNANEELKAAIQNARDLISAAQIIDNPEQEAVPHYQGLLDEYKNTLDDIQTEAEGYFEAGTSAENKNSVLSKLDELNSKTRKIEPDSKANMETYNAQVAEDGTIAGVQKVLDDASFEIASTDASTQLPQWQEKLAAIQTEIDDFANKIKEYYVNGQSVEKKDEVDSKAAELKNKINDLLAQQQEGYSEAIQADNQAAKDAFDTAIEGARNAFKGAVDELDKFRNVTNEELKDVVNQASADQNLDIYEYPQAIDELKKTGDETYASTKSPDQFDKDGALTKQANDYKSEIDSKKNDYVNTVKTAVVAYWNNKKAEFTAKLTEANNAISGYHKDAKKNAFKDIDDLIKKGDSFAQNPDITSVDEVLEKLANIDDMIDADKAKAAKTSIQKYLNEADSQIKKDRNALNKLADPFKTEGNEALDNNIKETVEAARTLYNDAATDFVEKHDEIKALIDAYDKTIVTQKQAEAQAAADNQKAFEEISSKLDEAQQKLDEAKAAVDDLKVADDFADEFDNLQKAIDEARANAEEAKENGDAKNQQSALESDASTVEDDINELIEDNGTVVAAEKEQLNKDINEKLVAEYNRLAAQGNEGAQTVKDEIEALKKAVDEAKSISELAGLEQQIANKYNELLKETEGADAAADSAALLEALNSKIAAQEALAELNTYDDRVKNDEAIKADQKAAQAAIADLKADVESKKDNIAFYNDQLESQYEKVAAQVESLIQDADARQEVVKANDAAYEKLKGEINELKAQKEEAENFINGLGEDIAAKYTETLAEVQEDIDELQEQLDEDNDNIALDDSSELDAAKTKAIEDALNEAKNNAANEKIKQEIQKLETAVNKATPGSDNEKEYSGKKWKEIMDAVAEANTAIEELKGYDQTKAAENYDETLQKIAEIQESIDAIDKKVNEEKLGDVNGDGNINVTDYQAIIDAILESGEKTEAMDVNGDGKVNIADAQAVANLILYGNILGKQQSGAPAMLGVSAAGQESISCEVVAENGNTRRIAINLDNFNVYAGYQFDVVLSSGMTLKGAALTNRGEGLNLQTAELADGAHRFVVASAADVLLKGQNGSILTIDVEGQGDVALQNVVFTTADAQAIEFNMGEATGISTLERNNDNIDKVYGMDGREVKTQKKGINIIRNTDGSTRKVIIK